MKEVAGLEAAAIRQEVLRSKTPLVMRGLVSDWPAVQRALDSAESLVTYLKGFDSGAAVDALMTAPHLDGRIFYNDDMSGFNFHRNRLPLTEVADQVLRYSRFPRSPAVAAQSALLRDCLPGFSEKNKLAVVAENILPRIWLGNRITTPTHLDEWNNIGCVVAGRRRFTLFPPDQIANLYIGPLDFAPTGAPMSLVELHDPDFERYPKFREAQAASLSAELAPGDAIFIPPLWWHHVESLQSFNVLVNYWWHDLQGDAVSADSAFDAMLHAMLSIRALAPETRGAWRALFEQYVFGTDRDMPHIAAQRRGVLGELTAPELAGLRAHLARRLSRT